MEKGEWRGRCARSPLDGLGDHEATNEAPKRQPCRHRADSVPSALKRIFRQFDRLQIARTEIARSRIHRGGMHRGESDERLLVALHCMTQEQVLEQSVCVVRLGRHTKLPCIAWTIERLTES